VVGYRARRSGGQIAQWGPGTKPGDLGTQEAEAKCESSVVLMFTVENLGFNEYRSRASIVYFANTQ